MSLTISVREIPISKTVESCYLYIIILIGIFTYAFLYCIIYIYVYIHTHIIYIVFTNNISSSHFLKLMDFGNYKLFQFLPVEWIKHILLFNPLSFITYNVEHDFA